MGRAGKEHVNSGSRSVKENDQTSQNEHSEENKDYRNTDDFYKNYGIEDDDNVSKYNDNSKSASKYDYWNSIFLH